MCHLNRRLVIRPLPLVFVYFLVRRMSNSLSLSLSLHLLVLFSLVEEPFARS